MKRVLVSFSLFFFLGAARAQENPDVGSDSVGQTQEILDENLRNLFEIEPEWAIDFAAQLRDLKPLEHPSDEFIKARETAPDLENFLSEVNTNIAAWRAAYDKKLESLREALVKGLVEKSDQGISFRILADFDQIDPELIASKVNSVTANRSDLKGTPFLTTTQASQVKEALNRLKELAIRKVSNPPSEKEIRGLSTAKPCELLKHYMNESQIQFPSKGDENGMTYDQLEDELRGEMTSIGPSLVSRIVIPHFDPAIVLVDVNFVDRYSRHMLMYLARQVVRAGRGDGRPVITLFYDSKNPNQPLSSQFFPKPKKWTAERFSNYWRAAMTPRTKSDALFSLLYVSTVMTLGYTATYFKNQHLLSMGSDPGPMPHGENITELASSTAAFMKANFLPLKSHFICSSLIGFFHPVYRFIIYHAPKGKEWLISLKHFFLISFPAGLATSFYTKGLGGIDPLTMAGLYEIFRVAINSLWTNYARPIAYSVPNARMNHRLNTKVWNLGGGFSMKRQQVEFESIYVMLFFLKFAQLIEMPGGNFAYFAAPFLAFGLSLGYFKLRAHEFNYSEDINRLKRALFMPVQLGEKAVKKVAKLAPINWCRSFLSSLKGAKKSPN